MSDHLNPKVWKTIGSNPKNVLLVTARFDIEYDNQRIYEELHTSEGLKAQTEKKIMPLAINVYKYRSHFNRSSNI